MTREAVTRAHVSNPFAARRGAPLDVLVLMGVSGSGKTTTGKRLSALLGWTFRDADEFHPQANIDKMASGVPLNDADRAPWLAAIAAWIDKCRASGIGGIVSCSSLKRAYRDVLIGARQDVGLVYLKGSRALIADRRSQRRGHFMPPSLLASQFQTLEEPAPEEHAIVVSIRLSPKRVAERIVALAGLPTSRLISPV
jgi:carbohydrate kinase (thermoresistant glucokinase family)